MKKNRFYACGILTGTVVNNMVFRPLSKYKVTRTFA